MLASSLPLFLFTGWSLCVVEASRSLSLANPFSFFSILFNYSLSFESQFLSLSLRPGSTFKSIIAKGTGGGVGVWLFYSINFFCSFCGLFLASLQFGMGFRFKPVVCPQFRAQIGVGPHLLYSFFSVGTKFCASCRRIVARLFPYYRWRTYLRYSGSSCFLYPLFLV